MRDSKNILPHLYYKFEDLDVPYPNGPQDNDEAYFYLEALHSVIQAETDLVKYLEEIESETEGFTLLYDDKINRTTDYNVSYDMGLVTRDFYIDFHYPELSILYKDMPEAFNDSMNQFKKKITYRVNSLAVRSIEPIGKLHKGLFRISISFLYNYTGIPQIPIK